MLGEVQGCFQSTVVDSHIWEPRGPRPRHSITYLQLQKEITSSSKVPTTTSASGSDGLERAPRTRYFQSLRLEIMTRSVHPVPSPDKSSHRVNGHWAMPRAQRYIIRLETVTRTKRQHFI